MPQYLPYRSNSQVRAEGEAQAAAIRARTAEPLARLQRTAGLSQPEIEQLYLEALAAIFNIPISKPR